MRDETIEEIQHRRAARKAAHQVAHDEQARRDLAALDELELEHGDGAVATIKTGRFAPGLPTFAVVRAPSGAQYKRFVDQVRKAGQNLEARGKAQDLLGESCLVYPREKAERDAMLAEFPGLLVSASVEAARLADLRGEEEGKG